MIHIEKEMFVLKDNLLEVSEWQNEFNLVAGFTTRNGGVSTDAFTSFNQSFIVGDTEANVLANRAKLAEQLGTETKQWVLAEQKHTANIREITEADCGAGTTSFESGVPNADALYTKAFGVMLATFHADCTPVYLYAPKQGFIGLIHAGWQGTVKEITTKFMEVWRQKGIKAKDVQVVIGPSAQQAAYEVGIDVVEQVLQMELEDARDAVIQMTESKFKIDVPYLNYLQLLAAGVPAEQITISAYCTISDKDLFYSYRRENETGRMLAYIMKK